MKLSLTLTGLALAALVIAFVTGCSDNQSVRTDALLFMGASANSRAREIWMMNADGANKQMLVQLENGSAIQGDLSPDGATLLYVLQVEGTGSQIIKRNLGSGAETVLVTDSEGTGNDFAPSFSPNGQQIAYHDDRDGIHVMNADGSDSQLIPADATDSDHYPTWSRDGSKIIFDRGWLGDICEMNADGSGVNTILSSDETYEYGQPSYLPDGRIVCMRNNTSTEYKDVMLMNADGSGLTNLTPDTEDNDDFSPTVNRAGDKIAFSSDRNGKKEIFVGTLSGSELTDLVNLTSDVEFNCWRPRYVAGQ